MKIKQPRYSLCQFAFRKSFFRFGDNKLKNRLYYLLVAGALIMLRLSNLTFNFIFKTIKQATILCCINSVLQRIVQTVTSKFCENRSILVLAYSLRFGVTLLHRSQITDLSGMINGRSIYNHQGGLGQSPVTINNFWGRCLEYDCWLTSKMVDQKL